MKTYSLTKAANMMDIEGDTGKDRYHTLIRVFIRYSIIRRGTISDGFYKNGKLILTKEFKNQYPKEAELYFEEYYTKQGFYQLKLTEIGVKEICTFIIR